MWFCCAFQLPISITRSDQMPGIGKNVISGAGKRVRSVKAFATKSNNLSWIPDPTQWKVRMDFHTSFSDFHKHAMACVCPFP